MSHDIAMQSGSPAAGKAESHGKVAPGEIALAVVIGRSSEFFDFFVYGIASVLVFPKLLFPYAEPLTATLYSFAIFSLAFVARPIGSVIFMTVGRIYGRGVKMTIALFMLGTSTAAMSFLPGYEQIGHAAAVLLAILRFFQGLALAGAWDGLASLLSLNSPAGRRGWYAMMPQLGAPLGFLLASSLFAFFVAYLEPADFLDWGWRYPFFAAFAVNVVALFARLRLVLSEAYSQQLETRDLNPRPVLEVLHEQGPNVVIGAFAPLASFALFHVVTIFPLSWITLFSDLPAAQFLVIEMAGAGVGLLAIIASGLLADRIGRRRVIGVCACLIAVYSFAAPSMLGSGIAGDVAYMLIGFALLGLAFGQSSGALTSNFTSRNRYTGAALTSDLAWLIGAGFAPLVALGVASEFGLAWVGAYLLSGALCTLASLGLNRQLVLND